jgi:hypothetical protein
MENATMDNGELKFRIGSVDNEIEAVMLNLFQHLQLYKAMQSLYPDLQ